MSNSSELPMAHTRKSCWLPPMEVAPWEGGSGPREATAEHSLRSHPALSNPNNKPSQSPTRSAGSQLQTQGMCPKPQGQADKATPIVRKARTSAAQHRKGSTPREPECGIDLPNFLTSLSQEKPPAAPLLAWQRPASAAEGSEEQASSEPSDREPRRADTESGTCLLDWTCRSLHFIRFLS